MGKYSDMVAVGTLCSNEMVRRVLRDNAYLQPLNSKFQSKIGLPVVETLVTAWRVFGLQFDKIKFNKKLTSAKKKKLIESVSGDITRYELYTRFLTNTKVDKKADGEYILYEDGIFYCNRKITYEEFTTAIQIYLGIHPLYQVLQQELQNSTIYELNSENNGFDFLNEVDFTISSVNHLFMLFDYTVIPVKKTTRDKHILSTGDGYFLKVNEDDTTQRFNSYTEYVASLQ